MIDMIIGIIIGMLLWQFFILIFCLFSKDSDLICMWGIGCWQLVCFLISVPSYFVKKWRSKRR